MPQDHAEDMAESQVKRLILCFDGTWNTPEDQTNVSRIYAAIADQHAGCESQLKFYDSGVGTSASSRLTGGTLGWGLDENILQGYCWLINEYQDNASESAQQEADGEVFDVGPDIFIFGFSRGAYTARSLAGLINRCGLPRREFFAQEHAHRAHTDADLVRRAWELYRKEFPSGVEGRQQADCVSFREHYCRTVKIKLLGIWDTVGALGVPMLSKSILSRVKYGFHDTSLGRVIEYAYHAVAIDEQREDYQVALWDAKHQYGTKDVEQRWFPGAHANVGGGYQDDLLPDPPLKWIAERALEQGLEFTHEFRMKLSQRPTCKNSLPEDFKLRGDEYLSPVRDSYAEFLHGIYRLGRSFILRGRYYRPMLVRGVGETIDETAHMKWAADPTYRPRNFAYAGRTDFGLVGRGTPVVTTAAPAASGNP
jgi:uncharacterized protein (DUF2235 family)